jgi:uncharacterized membrane protein
MLMKISNSNRQTILTTAIVSAMSAVASAQVHPEKPTYAYEKCYGIARAGFNDCFTAKNSCAGTTTKDSEPQAWIYVPKGTCSRIVGGSTTAPKE